MLLTTSAGMFFLSYLFQIQNIKYTNMYSVKEKNGLSKNSSGNCVD